MTPDGQRRRGQPSPAAAAGHPQEDRPDSTPASTEVAQDVCHVWLADAASADSVSAFRARRDFLSEDERERASRFVFEQDRDAYLTAHVLLRGALSSCCPSVEPSAWVFERAGRGRPEIAHPHTDARLRFNISHTRGLAACVVTAGVDCGVDVERIDRRIDVESLGASVLAASEVEVLGALPESARAEYFLRLWALKEAYAKARGLGLALPFNRLAVELGPPIQIHADTALEPDAAAWQFTSWTPATHVAAVAVRGGPATSFRFVKHTTPPRGL